MSTTFLVLKYAMAAVQVKALKGWVRLIINLSTEVGVQAIFVAVARSGRRFELAPGELSQDVSRFSVSKPPK